MLTFNNTEIAFKWRSNKDLRRARLLFKTISWTPLVWLGEKFVRIATTLRIPIAWLVKPTIFKHFVGGETLQDCQPVILKLAKYKVKSILDYSVEGTGSDKSQELAFNEILQSVNYASNNPDVPFTVFKPTGLIDVTILAKVSNKENLSTQEVEKFNLFKNRVDTLCQASAKIPKPILIDAEDTWYQSALDDVATDMMQKYNTKHAIVFNTLQMYRVDRLEFLKKSHSHALENDYVLGVKFVRGAYMEKERERAAKNGYPSPIHPNKQETDEAFDQAQEYALGNINSISIFSGTHNEESVLKLVKLMESAGISHEDPRVTFSQLYGMSDNISFILAHDGYNVAKYIPYGPVRHVMPYLIRRAQENTSVKGQTTRELSLVKKELQRRSK